MTEIESFLLNGPYRVVGVTGNAGAGKSTLARNLPSDKFISYGIDGRFVGDSQFRKRLLKAKAESSIHAYIDALQSVQLVGLGFSDPRCGGAGR